MTIDYFAWRFWADMGNYVATVAIGLYVWWDKRKIRTAQRFQAVEQWQARQAPRLDSLEAAMKAARTMCKEHQAAALTLCKEHQEQTESLDLRQQELLADYRSLPSRADLNKLSDQVGTIGENLGRMDGRLTGIGRAVDLMNQHLLKGGK